MFFQVPEDGEYEFWVYQHDADIGGIQNYGVAWWALSAAAPALGGDFDGDNDVDGEDLTEWTASFGEDDGADADNDGDSDGNDFLIWQRNLGMTAATPTNSPVPEPSAWMLSAFALLLLRRRAA